MTPDSVLAEAASKNDFVLYTVAGIFIIYLLLEKFSPYLGKFGAWWSRRRTSKRRSVATQASTKLASFESDISFLKKRVSVLEAERNHQQRWLEEFVSWARKASMRLRTEGIDFPPPPEEPDDRTDTHTP